jgi:ubiquinol-cytochrome c reductase cytochrome b subunit
VLSVAILYVLPFIKLSAFKSLAFSPVLKKIIWGLFRLFFLLTWIGARPVEAPYVVIGQLLTILYFLVFIIWPVSIK